MSTLSRGEPPPKIKMSRKTARDYAYKLIFEHLFAGGGQTQSRDFVFEDSTLTQDDRQYIAAATDGVMQNYDGLIALIRPFCTGFSLERMYKPDLAALLLAAYEIKHMPDIPYTVSVNECIELVKTYSTQKSAGYVNGILASIIAGTRTR